MPGAVAVYERARKRNSYARDGPKDYKLETKIIFRGNPVEGETISGGTMGDVLETKCGKK
jgi:hypothetical protein